MNSDQGHDALTRNAKAFFYVHLSEFLSMPEEEIQRLCRLADVDEAGFKAAMQTLIMAAPARGGAN